MKLSGSKIAKISFCKEFEQFTSKYTLGNTPKRTPKMSTSEIITIILFSTDSLLQPFC